MSDPISTSTPMNLPNDPLINFTESNTPPHDPLSQDTLTGSGTPNHNTFNAFVTNIDTLLNGPIDIGTYMDNTLIPASQLRQTLHSIEASTGKESRALALNQFDAATALSVLKSRMIELINEWRTLVNTQNAQISQQNSNIAAYNNQVQITMPYTIGSLSSDQYNTNQMNQAITDYNAGSITAVQFNVVATSYTNYVSSRNATLSSLAASYNPTATTFNNQVQANNQTITHLNAQFESVGLPPIAVETDSAAMAKVLPSQSLAPLPTPIPSLPDPSPLATLATIPAVPTTDSLLTLYYQPFFKFSLANLALSTQRVDFLNSIQNFIQFFLRGKQITSPPETIWLTNCAKAKPRMTPKAVDVPFEERL